MNAINYRDIRQVRAALERLQRIERVELGGDCMMLPSLSKRRNRLLRTYWALRREGARG